MFLSGAGVEGRPQERDGWLQLMLTAQISLLENWEPDTFASDLSVPAVNPRVILDGLTVKEEMGQP